MGSCIAVSGASTLHDVNFVIRSGQLSGCCNSECTFEIYGNNSREIYFWERWDRMVWVWIGL